MSEDVLINVTPMEIRVALVENGVLQEVYIERSTRKGIVGNIYQGKVVRVLPGMQAAFVDIGLERAAFIHVSEVADRDAINPSDQIGDYLREGQSLVVQVTKDPISTKGARLTTHLSIPSRYLVYMPDQAHVGVSQRIEDEVERDRLKSLVSKALEDRDETSGYILRTAAERAGEEEILSDINFLTRLWQSVKKRISNVKAPSVIYEDLPLHLRTMRDLVSLSTEKIRIDSKENYAKLRGFAEDFIPDLLDRIEYYPGERPIFDLYSVEDEIQRALDRKVQLKSGGYLLIEQTESMTTIDVNTGAFVGSRNLEETIYKTNLEAATAIGRQLRLRNLGGIIIIDFIDMEDDEHKRQVLRMLEKVLESDHAKTKITGVSELGLVEMTRKRTRESLGQVLCEPCRSCRGSGFVKTPETVCYEVLREIMRADRAYDSQTYTVLASSSVVERFLDEDSTAVAELEAFIGKTIRFQVDPVYTQDQYDVVLR
ncbi:Ribonuclease G [Marinomonas gallaica]|uniref:Ribonuclease G n=1 Tax=Marinomonas gallaica TaxID=1806667 RepID=A0A1C3JTP9_9GAMM|nr:ribonuclease G [Marinomonas gallaica]SBT18604.1 Ribonuclease G [Marinomonas gallaica]SBT21559.1 Ribonuclease G [Marinomonas gallaica]